MSHFGLLLLLLLFNTVNSNTPSTRDDLINTLFGLGTGILPSDSVPIQESISGPTAKGCYCAYYGECSASSCQYGNNMTKLIWNMKTKVNDSFTLDLNSTVIYTLNTSGAAPEIHDGAGVAPQLPGGGWFRNESNSNSHGLAIYPTTITDTLVLFHHGHSQPCNLNPDMWHDRAQDWLNQLGYDVMGISMPLHQLNYHKESQCEHSWFEQFEKQGVKTIGRYFLEPVVRTINYAKKMGYKNIVMMGLSGGGWTTTLMGAIDTRIDLSIPVAGSIPCAFNHTSWDYEQYCSNDWAQVCDYECLYALAGLEKNRYSVQLIHEQDPCCFHGYGRHDRIREYNARVQGQIEGHFETVVTVGNVHEVNERDKTVAASLIDRLRTTNGKLLAADFESMPFNTLKEW